MCSCPNQATRSIGLLRPSAASIDLAQRVVLPVRQYPLELPLPQLHRWGRLAKVAMVAELPEDGCRARAFRVAGCDRAGLAESRPLRCLARPWAAIPEAPTHRAAPQTRAAGSAPTLPSRDREI